MFRRPGRVITLIVSVFVLVVAAAVVYLLLPPRQTSDVAMPAPHATPEQIVTAYLNALKAHDCGTAEDVTVSGLEDSAKSWCHDVASLTDVEVRDHFIESPKWSGHSSPEEVANVPFHNDGSMDEGATTWGYLLVRESADAPWRIFDQGTG